VAYFLHDKAKTQDAWYAISGAANTGSSTEFNGLGQSNLALAKSGRRIYTELDFTWMYNLNDYTSLWIGGGILTAGNSIRNQKNAAYSYSLQTGNIVINPSIIIGRNGAAANGYMFFIQFNAAF